jgi:hypothetical protein
VAEVDLFRQVSWKADGIRYMMLIRKQQQESNAQGKKRPVYFVTEILSFFSFLKKCL